MSHAPVLHADPPSTGWQDLTALWPSITSGQVLAIRIGAIVWWRWASVVYSASGVEYAPLASLTGLLSPVNGDLGIISSLADAPVPRRVTQRVALVRPVAGTTYVGHLSYPVS